LRVRYDRVAAIDVHEDMIKVAVRVPGKKRGSRTAGVLEYRTFYGVLQAMARELRGRGVTHVVMEAPGGVRRAGVLRAGGAGFHRGAGGEPGARQGAEGPQDRREGRGAAAGGA